MTRTSHDEGLMCQCVRAHRPPALELNIHHIIPISMGGSNVASNRIPLCPTTHANVHEILRLMVTEDKMLFYAEVDKLTERVVPRYAYSLAVEGYLGWKELNA